MKTKGIVHKGGIPSLGIEGWIFEVFYDNRPYPNVVSGVYTLKREAQAALDNYLETGNMDFFGTAE